MPGKRRQALFSAAAPASMEQPAQAADQPLGGRPDRAVLVPPSQADGFAERHERPVPARGAPYFARSRWNCPHHPYPRNYAPLGGV